MFRIKNFFIACTCLCSVQCIAQQKYPNTLLWRITGNGLTNPSYLFGTMHLQDKRLFYFTDSVYKAIENAEGFAIELDPGEIADSILSNIDLNDRSSKVKDILPEKEYKKIKDQLEKKYKIPADQLTARQVRLYRRQKLEQSKKDDMSTFMDMYLYNIAEQQGKWTGGIEDVSDQMSIMNEMGGSMSPSELVNDDYSSGKSGVEQMKKIYLDQDLNGINSFFDYSTSPAMDDLNMIKRNHKMARRIDSISAIRSCFFAVGAAHLPGDSGVIQFLRDRGFTLTPILSSKKIAPGDYTYTHKEKEWNSFTDDNDAYTILMPGKPTLMNIQQVLPLNVYMDLGTITIFGVGATASTAAGENTAERMDMLLEKFKSSGYNVLNKKIIEVQGAKGIEIFADLPGSGFYRMQLLGYENRLFLLLVGGQTKETPNSADANRFLNSMLINKTVKTASEQWQTFTDKQCGVSILLPGNTKAKPFVADEDKNGSYKTYTSPDLQQGGYYMLIINDMGPGFYLKNDSESFALYQKYFETKMNVTGLEKTPFIYKGYQACKFTGLTRDKDEDVSIQCVAILRGNRTYQAWAIVAKAKKDFPEVTNFFRSIEFLPYDTKPWTNQGDETISINAPAPFVKNPKSPEFEVDDLLKFYSRDEVSATSFLLEKKPISKYFWISSDSAYWADKMELIHSPGDSLLYQHTYHSGSQMGADFAFSLAGTKLKKQLKYVVTNDTVYCVYSFLSNEMYNDKRVKDLFAGFTVSSKGPFSLSNNKAAVILNDLRSKDSLTRDAAIAALRAAPFTSADLPALHTAFFETYIYDTANYRTINDHLADVIGKIKDPANIDFVKNNYPDDKHESLRTKMIMILAEQKDKASFAVIKDLLLQQKKIGGGLSGIGYLLFDSLLLSKDLFPEAGILLNDSSVGPVLCALAIRLIDSNLVAASMFMPYEDKLVALAGFQFNRLLKDKEAYSLYTEDMMELLGKLNTQRSNAAVMQLLSLKQLYIKQAAILTLLKNNIPVPAKEIYEVAADKGSRIYFYEKLRDAKKTDLFPAAFMTQEKFAESYAFNFLDEEEEVTTTSLNFIQEKTNVSDGKKNIYYLFKAVVEDYDKPQLIIVGPFPSDKTSFHLADSYEKVWMDNEPYSANKINAAFNRMLNPVKEAEGD